MVPRTYFQLLLFLLSLLYLSCRSNMESDFENWISWNMKSYQKKSIMEKKYRNVSAIGQGLDLKLRQAESKKISLTVSQNGAADFKSITEAINSIPPYNTRRVILLIAPGVYREKIVIPKTLPFITFLGDSRDRPTITGNDTASVAGNDGALLRTFNSATVAVNASYFVAINIKFENTAYVPIGSEVDQAVALRISGTKAAFYNCSFYGVQDTLYDHKGLHYFKNCFIQGSVDFIFGYGRSLYEGCTINSITKNMTSITAQKRSSSSLDSGFSFKNSTVTGSGRVYLGRPWGDYSRVVFSYTFMDKIVLPKGWKDWEDQKHYLNVYYGEYKCSGPGSNFTGRVPWARLLTDEEAQPFIGIHFIEGDTWLISP
ncbi:probable pectinesterase 53 isoform X2 [Trifolium pratense]|uniref:probable pectinesterase 53 isoform X2 n=1 Tax=Trifolium pratense TaxID=57577 RepID=UPI001E692244|nr:probable pectinesterase 53 isoform X2 [Trifolium pratense]